MFKFVGKGIKRIPFFQTFFVKTALRFSEELLINFLIKNVFLQFKIIKVTFSIFAYYIGRKVLILQRERML